MLVAPKEKDVAGQDHIPQEPISVATAELSLLEVLEGKVASIHNIINMQYCPCPYYMMCIT